MFQTFKIINILQKYEFEHRKSFINNLASTDTVESLQDHQFGEFLCFRGTFSYWKNTDIYKISISHFVYNDLFLFTFFSVLDFKNLLSISV